MTTLSPAELKSLREAAEHTIGNGLAIPVVVQDMKIRLSLLDMIAALETRVARQSEAYARLVKTFTCFAESFESDTCKLGNVRECDPEIYEHSEGCCIWQDVSGALTDAAAILRGGDGAPQCKLYEEMKAYLTKHPEPKEKA